MYSPRSSRGFLNREQNPVILGFLAVEIDIAGSGQTSDAAASQHPVLEQVPYPFRADAQPGGASAVVMITVAARAMVKVFQSDEGAGSTRAAPHDGFELPRGRH